MRLESMDATSAASVRPPEPAQPKPVKNAETETAVAPATDSYRANMRYSEYEKRDLPVSEKLVIEAIEKANKAITGSNRKFEFSIHEATKEIMIKVLDSDTNEVVREIPNEKILDMVAKMWEMAGIMVDERR